MKKWCREQDRCGQYPVVTTSHPKDRPGQSQHVIYKDMRISMQGHKGKLSTALAVVYLLALAGVLVAGMLTYWHIVGADVPCTNQGCDIVAQSPYSRIFGIPVAALGLGFYAFCTAVTALLPSLSRKAAMWLLNALLLFCIIAVMASIYLTYLELAVIHAVCQWCMASALISLLLLPASIVLRRIYHRSILDEG